MIREIKFRGFQKSWIYGGVSIFENEATIFDVNCVICSAYEVDINSIGQFTYFKDCNGKEIFEGDILQYVYVRDATQCKTIVVHFSESCGSWLCSNAINLCDLLVEQNNDDWKRSQNWSINKNQYVRVIGNIYENAELLNY